MKPADWWMLVLLTILTLAAAFFVVAVPIDVLWGDEGCSP
jgi:hypothetical protein